MLGTNVLQETRVRSLGQEDPLEKEIATHSSTLAWRIPWREEPGRLQSTGSQRVGHDWATELNWISKLNYIYQVSLVAQTVKRLSTKQVDLGPVPGSGRSPGEGNGNPLQYSCLENPMEGGAWKATVHGVTKSWTRLSDFTFTFKAVELGYTCGGATRCRRNY